MSPASAETVVNLHARLLPLRLSRCPGSPSARVGQALIETCVVMALTCLIFFGILQVARLFAAGEILNHAAARGARAETVGLNWWMVEKSIRVASIPNAGRITEPVFDTADPVLRAEMQGASSSGDLWTRVLRITPISRQYDVERVKIPEYLAADNDYRADFVLNYSEWDTVQGHHGSAGVPDPVVHVIVRQDFSNSVPMHRTFYAEDSIPLHGEAWIENHYPLYLDDQHR